MIHLSVLRLRPDKLDRLTDWFSEANERGDEVRQTFAQEGVRHEQAYLLHTADGPLVIYVEEVKDIVAAEAAFRSSTIPIDAEHKAVMAEVIDGKVDTTLLFDMTADGGRTQPGPDVQGITVPDTSGHSRPR
ncbi:DUF6176 family protein [Kutzneria sp. NPDC051319]|uniref:DUF6176 family protein n=1 Tax=Kutzneria sp. NPDC051319 TaxID=3155047 RepID=UPI00343F4CAE